jgi:hypothetical protein
MRNNLTDPFHWLTGQLWGVVCWPFKHLMKVLPWLILIVGVLVILPTVVKWAYLGLGVIGILFALITNNRRLVSGIFVGYGLSLGGMALTHWLSSVLHPHAVYQYTTRSAADLAAGAAFTHAHSLIFAALMTLLLGGFAAGAIWGLGAAAWRIRQTPDQYDPRLAVNHFMDITWHAFPLGGLVDNWCNGAPLITPRAALVDPTAGPTKASLLDF